MKKTLTTAFSLLLSISAFSQEKTEDKGKFTFSGYVDSYYMLNFNNPENGSNLGDTYARAFDAKSSQFSLGLIQTKVAYATAKSDVVVDLTFGPNANAGNYGNAIGTALAIKQAYFNWKASDKLTFTAGQFGTHIGYEVIDAPVNYHYSLSYLFNNGPFYHIGVKAAYAVSDKFSIMGGLVNNVDNLNDNNKKLGLIAQVFVVPTTGWNVYINGITSNEASKDVAGVKANDASYNLLDLTTTYQVNEKFMVGLNVATGSQTGDYQGTGGPSTKKTWGGWAIYPKYDVSSTFSIGARYESFSNKDGVRGLVDANGAGVAVNSLTITPTFTVADSHLLLKPEFRIDTFDKDFFTDGDGKRQKSQATLGLAMIYKF